MPAKIKYLWSANSSAQNSGIYSDFKTVMANLPFGGVGTTYYCSDANLNAFTIVQIPYGSEDFLYAQLSGSSPPSGFSSDFPAAVSLNETPGNWSPAN